jgi:hypothetical protein
MDQEIAISGKSCITSLGEGLDVWLDAILRGKAVDPQINPDMFQAELDVLQKGPYEMYRVQKIAAITLLKALEDARIKITENNADRVSILFGSSYEIEEFKSGFFKIYKESDPKLTSPSIFPYTASNAVAAGLSILFGIKGTNITFSNGITAASEAIIAGRDLLASGKTDAVIVMGTNFFCDDFDSELHNCGFRQECCAAVVLERAEDTKPTGKNIYAKIEQARHGFMERGGVKDNAECVLINRGDSFGRSFTSEDVQKGFGKDAVLNVDMGSIFGNTFSASGVLGIILGSLFLEGSKVLKEHYGNTVPADILFINEDSYGSRTSVVIKK